MNKTPKTVKLHEVVIPATSGARTVWKDGKPTLSYVSTSFKEYQAKGLSTSETPVAVMELREDATFKEAFESLGKPEDLALTQDQILSFVENHKDKLHPKGWATFFLLKSGKDYLVASVSVDGGGSLVAYAYRFEYDGGWDAEYRHRLVVPLKTVSSDTRISVPSTLGHSSLDEAQARVVRSCLEKAAELDIELGNMGPAFLEYVVASSFLSASYHSNRRLNRLVGTELPTSPDA